MQTVHTSEGLVAAMPSLDLTVEDNSRGNSFQNQGHMNVVHGNNNMIQNVQSGINPLDIISDKLTWILDAEFDVVTKAQRRACTPQTRTAIIEELSRWCQERNGFPLYWLSGMAGTGKTTIVYTLCQVLKAKGKLGASFFCSRSVEGCQDIHHIIPTIAYQIATQYDAFAEELFKVLRRDPNIGSRELSAQLEQLIIKPFAAKADNLPTNLVVVLDALDECKEEHSQFLGAVAKYATMLPFKLLISSRPEYVIDRTLSAEVDVARAGTLALHEIAKDLVRADVIKFLMQELAALSPPPTSTTIDLLAYHSGSLFIYAATFARFITHNPLFAVSRLRHLLSSLETSQSDDSIMAPLNTLYTSILSRAFGSNGLSKTEIGYMRLVLYTIVCAREPMTKQSIAGVWGLSEDIVESALRPLQSVIFLPKELGRPVTTFHVSFLDFLLDQHRSGGFFCDSVIIHTGLATVCFQSMIAGLHQNICKLEGRRPNGDINQEVVRAHITPGLSYACCHWAAHLDASSKPTPLSLLNILREFMFTRSLYWLECLAIIRQLAVSATSLEITAKFASEDHELFDIAREIRSVVLHSYDAIDYCCLETYRSALAWVPLHSPLRSYFLSLWQDAPQILRGLPTTWTGPEQMIHIHSMSVNAVTLSAHGSRIISASDDMTVRIWNTASRTVECILGGHNSYVMAVAISPDDHWVVSGSWDRTIRVWNLAAQETIFVLKGHIYPVTSIAISHDGRHICSGDDGGTIRLWSLTTGRSLLTMHGHQDAVCSVAFAIDGIHLVSGSFDQTARIWDLTSGPMPLILRGHEKDIRSVAVSPFDCTIITGSRDATARIWSLRGSLLCVLIGHAGLVWSVAFFHDGSRAASGSEDRTIRIWNIKTGSALAVLSGHSADVTSIAISFDSRYIVSGTEDGSMSIWIVPETARAVSYPSCGTLRQEDSKEDKRGPLERAKIMAASSSWLCMLFEETIYILDTRNQEKPMAVHVGEIELVVLSTHGMHLATSADTWIQLSIIGAAQEALILKGHERHIKSISFSHNGHHLVSTSEDGTARVWCTRSGIQCHVLRHSWNDVRCASFSHDNNLIVSCTSGAVYIWNATTGQRLQQLVRFSRFGRIFSQVVFSVDNCHVISSRIGANCPDLSAVSLETGHLIKFTGFQHSCALSSGVVYAYHESGWIHKVSDLRHPPQRICWIPSQHRPKLVKHSRGRYGRLHGQLKAFSLTDYDLIVLCNDQDESKSIIIRIPNA